MNASRRPGQRAGLTPERVLAEARRLLAQGGMDALTMRALAARLQVSPNALYSHVASKTALVDELLDDLLAEVPSPTPGSGDPISDLHALMTATYDLLLAHADLVALYLDRQGARGPNAQHLGEIVLAQLARAGVSEARRRDALRVLIIHTIGFAAFTSRSPLAPQDAPGPPPRELVGSFGRSLSWLLTGIVQSADAQV